MTRHYRWDTTMDQRRRDDPGIDDRPAGLRPATSAMPATSATTSRSCASSRE